VGEDVRHHSLARRAAAGLIALVLVAAACGSGDDDGGEATATTPEATPDVLVAEGDPVEGGKLVMAVTAETNGWNPATAQWADAGSFVGSSFLEPLFVYNSDADLVPWLAKEMVPNNDQSTSWTLRIRPDITFHDGTPVDAQAVAASLNLYYRVGLAKIAFDDLVSNVTVHDDLTLTIDLTLEWAAFPHTMAGGSGYVMAQAMIDEGEAGGYGADKPIGTGPFEFDSWTPDSSVKVSRFDDYWGGPCALPEPEESVKALCAEIGVPLGQPNGPFLDAMEFRPIVDHQQRANALASGDVDLIMSTRAVDVRNYKDSSQVVTDFHSEKTFTMLNVSQPPFDNIHARKALAYATNRQAIVDQVSAGEPIASDTSPFSESSKWGGLAPDETGYPAYDPAAATAEIEQYKADTGQTALTFGITGLATTEDLAVMQTLQEMWRAVGIEASIETIEQTSYIIQLTQGDFQAAYFRNYGYPDPDSQYVFWSEGTAVPPIIINFSQYTSKDHEDALQLGRFAPQFDVRKAAYANVSRERNEQVIDVWLFNTPYSLIGDPDIGGLNSFRVLRFGNFQPKPYIGALWIERS
jgi:peptide/nickel transport system substrate-binding protein